MIMMRHPERYILQLLVLLMIVTLSSCYNKRTPVKIPLLNDSVPQIDSMTYARHLDSITFARTHHYSENFNFVVRADSVVLLRQQPEEEINNMQTDSFPVKKDMRMVVADIRIIANGQEDSVWVQLATENADFGWIRESKLLPKVDSDDPISQFISIFSDSHIIVFLVVFGLMGVAYMIHKLRRKKAKMVHFDDIDSFYPTLLALNVAAAATFYASIQLFAPEVWREFYFHPSLNPFSQPVLLALFLVSVWSMIIVAVAAFDDVRRHLNFEDAILYLCGLAAVCAFNYIVFSISTLYFVGYALLVAYIYYAIRAYLCHNRNHYICGNCGALMREKGRCPSCGVLNE